MYEQTHTGTLEKCPKLGNKQFATYMTNNELVFLAHKELVGNRKKKPTTKEKFGQRT